MIEPEDLRASVVITTRNRREELRNAITTAMAQTVPLEVLVVDDCSTDGTAEMVRREFPRVRLFESPQSQGYIVQRNRGAQLAKAPVIVSIDDDAALPSIRTIEQTLAAFDHPRVGAVTIPYVDVVISPKVNTRAPADDGIYVTSHYIGTAHAVRRDLFLRLGGYRDILVHFGEERDFGLRMLNAGYVTRLGTADVLHHFVSSKRDNARGFTLRSRNSLLHPWYNTPALYLLPHLGASTFNVLKSGLTSRHPVWAARGLIRGVGAVAWEFSRRSPVSSSAYRLARELDQVSLRIEQVEPRLAPIAYPDLPATPFAGMTSLRV